MLGLLHFTVFGNLLELLPIQLGPACEVGGCCALHRPTGCSRSPQFASDRHGYVAFEGRPQAQPAAARMPA